MFYNKESFYNKKIHKKNFNSNTTSLLWIVNRQFWKSWLSPFFAFLFPVFFIGILGGIFGYNLYFGSMLTIASASVGLISLPQAIFEFKNSILLKRIGSTKITIKKFLFTIVSYYFLIMSIATIFSFLMSLVLFSPNWHQGKSLGGQSLEVVTPLFSNVKIESQVLAASFETYLKNIDYPGAIYSFLVGFGVSAALGIFVSSIAKSTASLQAISVPILILSQFLSAQVMSLQFLVPVAPLRYLGYLTPFKGATSINIQSFQGQTLENWGDTSYVQSASFGEYINSVTFKEKLQTQYPFLTEENIKHLVDSVWNKFSSDKEIFKATLENQEFSKWFGQIQEFMQKEIAILGATANGEQPPQMNPVTPPIDISTNNIIFSVTQNVDIKQANPFDISQDYNITDKSFNKELIQGFSKIEKLVNLVLPWVWIVLLWTISIKTFKWDTR